MSVPLLKPHKPLAIAMWDFSWIERRWPNAGDEDRDRALDWGSVKELCAHSVEEAVKTGRWTGIATSRPQFTGMWRDVDWHQRLTKRIRESSFA
jgi:hypothetical protein